MTEPGGNRGAAAVPAVAIGSRLRDAIGKLGGDLPETDLPKMVGNHVKDRREPPLQGAVGGCVEQHPVAHAMTLSTED